MAVTVLFPFWTGQPVGAPVHVLLLRVVTLYGYVSAERISLADVMSLVAC